MPEENKPIKLNFLNIPPPQTWDEWQERQRNAVHLTPCDENREFAQWLHKRLPSLFLDPSGLFPPTVTVNKQPPDGATPADMDEAIILISEEYVRRCRAMSSPHERKHTDFTHEHKHSYCIHEVFQEAIRGVVRTAALLRQGLEDKAEELRWARHWRKVAEQDNKSLLWKIEQLSEELIAAKEALRESEQKAQEALREKEQELQSAYKFFRNALGNPVTPQQPVEDEYPGDRRQNEQLPDGHIPNSRDLEPYKEPRTVTKTDWQIQKEGGDTGGNI